VAGKPEVALGPDVFGGQVVKALPIAADYGELTHCVFARRRLPPTCRSALISTKFDGGEMVLARRIHGSTAGLSPPAKAPAKI